MDLGFTDEQETLKQSARTFVEAETSPALARAPWDDGVDQVWQRMVELGWPAVAIPEIAGGAGMSLVESTILLEEIGRGIVPGPLFATAGLYVPALRSAPPGAMRDRMLADVASGATGTLAIAEDGGSWAWEELATTAKRSGTGWTLTGTKKSVVEGRSASEILVVARDPNGAGDGIGLFAVPGTAVSSEPMEALDPSLRLARVALESVEVSTNRVLAEPGAGSAVITRSLQESLVAASILIVGACGSILDRTIEYAKTRKQFDQPIGGFQAVKHKLTDMYVAVERARSLTYFAALTICEDDPRRETAASMAKAAAGDCQRLVVEDGLQLHGGIGYTWEYDLHVYLKRAASLEALLGSSRVHRKRIAARLGLTATSAG